MKEIIEKYPKIFVDYEGNPYRENWYGVPDGWLSIVDDLCCCIQNYVDNTTIYSGNEYKHPSQPTCTTAKEKWNTLRFYLDRSDDMIEGMIQFASHLCSKSCIVCGSTKNVEVSTSGWIQSLCEEHRK